MNLKFIGGILHIEYLIGRYGLVPVKMARIDKLVNYICYITPGGSVVVWATDCLRQVILCLPWSVLDRFTVEDL